MSDMERSVQAAIPVQHGFYLSPINRGDKAAYLRHYADPTIANNLLLVPYPYTEADADFWINLRETHAQNPETFFAIRREDGYLIGAIGTGFNRTAEPKAHAAEFGYWLCSEFRGRNLMPAVIQVFAHHCFTRLGIHRLQATIFHFNAASGKALLKAGFSEEGLLRHYYQKKGEFIDAISYSLLATDPVTTTEVKTVT